MWRLIFKYTDFLALVLAYLSGFTILCIALLQLLEIIIRNTVGYSLPFVWEYAAYMHICAVFLAAAYTLRTGGHIQVTLLKSINPRIFEGVATFIGLLISLFLSWSLVSLAYGYGETGRTSSTINAVPLVYPAAIVAFGALMLSLQLILRLVKVVLDHPAELSIDTVPTGE
ncbi:TRAP transporter small permease [Halomonas sp. HAL1]|uniref:TRAP transporter small permease n=1 Tax=Halomonas sp. HAL1 TaxID=550984 RepID=UPI00022D2998|nr:TRAP transporter small permease [Halomonas sp. HAL1]EHA14896.1 tripartite ATP-independent periplasmic transporter DctQ [Halomonas sp. HAL1]WKV94172.1 TRAP transporter small permease [Halomonas sp. HAL1]